jgi:hypothetical protein
VSILSGSIVALDLELFLLFWYLSFLFCKVGVAFAVLYFTDTAW